MHEWIDTCIPEGLACEIRKYMDTIREVRLRAGKPVQLVCGRSDRFVGENMTAEALVKIALAMMDFSYYTREDELSRGFFTLKDGCRVGVCGSFTVSDGKVTALKGIGSLCIRIAREIQGCASEAVSMILTGDRPAGALFVSPPGYGKTTMLRDTARQLSERGFCIGIADERHEIAGCINGIPTMDIGCRSDVSDGCPKATAMEQLIRSMAPQILIADEIGNQREAEAVSQAFRRGVTVILSVHADSLDAAEHGILEGLFRENVFGVSMFLSEEPGRITEVRRYGV